MNDIEKAIETLKEQYITVSKCLFAEEATERNNAISLAIQALEEKLNGGWIPVSDGKYIIEVKEGEVASCQNFEI